MVFKVVLGHFREFYSDLLGYLSYIQEVYMLLNVFFLLLICLLLQGFSDKTQKGRGKIKIIFPLLEGYSSGALLKGQKEASGILEIISFFI